ncbi:sigma-70 family RNA polymerase sigma factor [Sphingobacterium sp. N143]|uniref:RNA polymerase sigma factor n=1 Tax=Sphingobacterium sp. N143 TaxID=2746727 RepID=UPI002575B893|nr:sigma-70 family RNA polymerase sigma factor [Sphingobacterium sp. N143]MDM1294208.1 sigma-70 family RNA polymerase sigma factor [Sphingobacterium sp. N143]
MKNKVNQEFSKQDFIESFREGKRTGLQFLYKTFYGPMCYFLEKMDLDKSIIEEIVQDVFFKLWERRLDFDYFESVRGFLYTSCRNAALNRIQQQTRSRQQADRYTAQVDLIDLPISHQIVYMETLREVHEAIETLPEQCRHVMFKLVVEDLSPQEVAVSLGITTSTVYNQKKRGIELLRKRLKPDQFFCLLLLLLHY